LQVVARETGDLVGDAFTKSVKEKNASVKAERAARALKEEDTNMINSELWGEEKDREKG